MPYTPEELREISKELEQGEDPTLAVADKTGGGFDPNAAQYHPVIDRNEHTLVRNNASTLDWKNYRLEVTFEDGTHQEFVFTAKDDGSAQTTVADRMKYAANQKGKYKLSLVEAPKEIFAGELGGSNEVTVATNTETAKDTSKAALPETKQAEKSAAAKEDFKNKADAEKAKNK